MRNGCCEALTTFLQHSNGYLQKHLRVEQKHGLRSVGRVVYAMSTVPAAGHKYAAGGNHIDMHFREVLELAR